MFYFFFDVQGLTENSDYLKAIRLGKEAVARQGFSPTEAFPMGGVYVYWEVFAVLFQNLQIIACISAGVNLVVSAIFLGDVCAAIVVFFVCIVIVCEVGGLCCFWGAGLDWNIFIAQVVLATVAIAIQDVAHTVAFFLNSVGTTQHKLAESMTDAFIAILEGSVTTLLTILPMIFHPAQFYMLYFTLPFSILVIVGVVNGCFFVPALLTTMDFVLERARCGKCKQFAV